MKYLNLQDKGFQKVLLLEAASAVKTLKKKEGKILEPSPQLQGAVGGISPGEASNLCDRIEWEIASPSPPQPPRSMQGR